MPMNPRLLRPSSTFTPRSISGLALWLDAADSSTLYTTDAGPVTAVSSPLDIAGCALWLDGADSSAASMTLDGTAVGSWLDKSGNNRHFTATGSARPTLTSSVINGRSAVTFNGSTTTMAGNAAAQAVIRNLPGYTVFSVLRTASVASGARVAFGVGATVLIRMWQQDSRPVVGGRRAYADTLEDVVGASGTLSVGVAYIQSATVNHAAQTLVGLRNGSAFGTDATYVSAGNSENSLATVCVGTQGDGVFGPWNGEVAELIVYPTALSLTDRARVEAYLAAKWGISGVHAPATATNDPVGAWLDKSGNRRHATQATAGRRGARGSQNSRTAVSLDGIDDHLILGDLSAAFPSAAEVAVAYAAPSDASYVIYQTANNDTSDAWGTQTFSGAFRAARLNGLPLTWPTGSILFGVSSDSSAHRIRLQGADVVTSAANFSAGTSHAIGARTASPDGTTAMNGRIAEVVAYSRVLTTSERTRLYRYLAAKWGITLAPQVSNADAQDWVNRVYAAGGTVSATTANAVNQFCVDIENAGIRDRFYRLNLFCGNSDANLAAVRTPLFRGPSLTGTQFGNATDTNNNFVAADYAETGANGGLKSDGATKFLNTGFKAPSASASPSDFHIGVYAQGVEAGGTSRLFMGMATNQAGSNLTTAIGWVLTGSASGTGIHETTFLNAGTTDRQGMLLAVNDGNRNTIYYDDGTSVATHSGARTDGFETGAGDEFFVLARNFTGAPQFHALNKRVRAYSIGLAMTSSQVSAFQTAMVTFQTALSRNV